MPTTQACTAPTGAQRKDQGKGLLFFRATQLCVPEHKPCALSVPARERKRAVQKQPRCSVPHFCSQTSAAENCSFQEGQARPSAQRWSSAAVLQNKGCWRRTRFTSALQPCQTAGAAVHSTLGSGGASPPQSFYLGASDMPFDLLRATIPQQANQPRAASSLEARSCGRSEISQGITSKAPSDNLPDAVQAQLFSARNSNYSFVQLLYMGFSKSRDKIPLLKTRMVYLRHPQRVTRGRGACKDLLPPLGFSPVLFASRWADQALVGCRDSIARTWLTRAFKEKLSKMERTKWGSCCRFPSCSKRHTSAELAVPAAACDESQEGLQGSYRHGRAGVPHHKTKPQPSHRMGPQGGPGQLYSPAGQLSAPTASRGCPAGWHWPLSRGALCQAFPAPDPLSREDGLQQASCSCG